MKPYFLLLFLLGTLCSYSQTASPEMTERISGFSHPESVVLDTLRNVLYVSNMAGKEPGDGFITKVSREGKILDTTWITGLNDPKGLLVVKDKLYTTDVTEIIEIDIEKGRIINKLPVDNSRSLNDLDRDQRGDIFISDLVGNQIFRMDPSGEITIWISDPDLKRPNGVLVKDEKIFIASWGQENPGKLLHIDRRSKEISPVTSSGIGNLDGIQEVEEGILLISDWGTGDIYQVNHQGHSLKRLSTEKSSGDILYIQDTEELFVPMNHQNALWWYTFP